MTEMSGERTGGRGQVSVSEQVGVASGCKRADGRGHMSVSEWVGVASSQDGRGKVDRMGQPIGKHQWAVGSGQWRAVMHQWR